MNYLHHTLIGVGTAALSVVAAEALGAPPPAPINLGLGVLAVAAGSIATDLDHPRSFISNTIPTQLLRITLAVLAIPLFAALGSYLTTQDLGDTLTQFSTIIWGVTFLRWTATVLFGSLVLMVLSLVLYKSLHHRGPLHSLLFTALVSMAACSALALLGAPWVWGLIFGWGWLWHILADGLTDQGVPFSWPFNDERKHTLPKWARGIGRVVLSLGAVVGIILLIINAIKPYFV